MTGFDRANTGHSPEATGPIGDPTVEWVVQPSRSGSPRIAVVDGLLVVVGDETAVAFDLETNERRWSVDVDGPTPPAADDGACYLASTPSRVRAYERTDGSVRWTIDADATLSAPVVSGDTVFVSDESGRVQAIDARNGEMRWDASVGNEGQYDSPVATDGTHLVANTDDAVVVLDTDEGIERWRASLPCCTRPAPVIADETVYTLGHELVARGVADGGESWRFEPPNVDPVGPTIDYSHVYTGQHSLDALDRASGDRRWQANGDLRSLRARPVAGNETVYVAVGDRLGRVAAVDATDGTVRWTEEIGEVVDYLAVAGEWLFAGTGDGSLYALTGSAGP